MRSRGFTLLEVMVATAIFGLTLTVILSAQGGLAASNKTANMMGTGMSLGRCKMTELEEKLLKFGYPITDEIQTDVSCCNDEDTPGYKCDTRAETVLLPNPPGASGDGDGGMALAAASPSGAAGTPGLPAGLPAPIGQALTGAAGGGLDLDGGSLASLSLDGGIAALGTSLQQQMGLGTGSGAQGLLSIVMAIVYPSIKPMFEMSIRRLTVTVRWNEGPNARDFTLVQYVTNPQGGGFIAGAPAPSGSVAPGGTAAPAVPIPGVGTTPGLAPTPVGGPRLGPGF